MSRGPRSGAASGAGCAGRTPELALGPADRARDSARCWGDGTESCETAHGEGDQRAQGQGLSFPLDTKNPQCTFQTRQLRPARRRNPREVPSLSHIAQGVGVCACTACRATGERGCGRAPGLQGKVPALLPQPLHRGVHTPGKGGSSGAASWHHRARPLHRSRAGRVAPQDGKAVKECSNEKLEESQWV